MSYLSIKDTVIDINGKRIIQMIKFINVSKSFGAQDLLESVSFHINAGEKVGLAGRNGHGKTTIFKMITGEEHPDSGEISIPNLYTIGHVKQHLDFTEETVVREVCLGLPGNQSDDTWKAEKILLGLGFSMEDMDRHPGEFSGGYQVRVNLAKVLVSEPDLLLLDEPTNFLDVISIRWLASFLRSWKGELMLITHDRGFMDQVVTHTLGIHRKGVRKVAGNTEKLYDQILKEEEIYEKTRINDQKKRKETEQYISRFRAKARLAGLVQSRIKALEKRERLDKLEVIKTMDFSFSYHDLPAKYVLSCENLSFGYDETPLFKNLSFSIARHDRIAVIGKNGKGKTTLLKVLQEELKPRTGNISRHHMTSRAYYAQMNTVNLHEKMTVEDEIMSAGCDRQRARDIAGALMFEGDNALKKISVLSGGEKSRVLLGRILASPCNLLLLDEPTNHLDMEACDSFMAAIDSFPGAVVIVTHNEMFLHGLANRFIVFQGDSAMVHEGSYQSFLDKIGWEEEETARNKKNNGGSVNKKEVRKLRSELVSRRSRELRPLEKRIETLEENIVAAEDLLDETHRHLAEASSRGDGNAITRLSRERHDIQTRIDALYGELDSLTRELDGRNTAYENELSELPSI